MKKFIVVASLAAALISASTVSAAPTGRLNQTINAGVLSTDVLDAGNISVTSPSFNMSSASVSNSCQTITGVYGSTSQRVSVDNPGGANNGFVLSLAATGGPTAKWTSGANNYSFNDAAGAGCATGQLTVDPSVSTLTVTGSSTATGMTKGTSTAFVSGTANSITLLTAAASSDDIWNGYLTGIGLSQKVPPSKPAGTYVLDLTQTVTAS